MIHIIAPGYNAVDWVGKCIHSVADQTYKDFRCWIIDDASTDGTSSVVADVIRDDERFQLFRNEINRKSLANYYHVIHHCIPNLRDDDIIVRLDLDDWLAHNKVLDNLINIYNHGYWMTYGTWKTYPQNQVGDHMCIPIPDWVDEQNAYRQWGFHFSHLKTHKVHLFKKINKQNLIDPTTNAFFTACDDLAYIFPMVEMAGKSRIYLNTDVSLVLNRENPLNEGKIMMEDIARITNYICNLPPYQKI